MDFIIIRNIEEAALNAWPAHQQILFDGWLLRFTNGYTKRANSVNPIYESVLDLTEKIGYCEAIYCRNELPPIFRLTPLAPEDLDLVLQEIGYKKLHPTRVLILPIEGRDFPIVQENVIRELPLEQWMGVFSEISGSLVEMQPAHTQILRNMLNSHITAAIEISGKWVACGLGVLQRDWFGLFDIVTHPDFRQQGFGTLLVNGMLDWAKSMGAKKSYLQVLEINTPALGLYGKLGYADAYEYWYRVPKDWSV